MARLLVLDFGTNGVRVGVFDFDARRMLGEREERYPTRHPRLGWAEQSALDWWDAFGRAARALLRELGRPEIAGVCVATTASTVVACRRDGEPLRPAILWMDCRAAEQADRTAASRHPVMAYSGGSDAAEWLAPKAMWMERREPEIYKAAEVVCECIDYVNYKLTGRWVGSRMNATCKWNYNSVAGRFLSILGAAAFAATGAGLAKDLFADAEAVAQPAVTLDPDPQAHARYQESLADYREATDLLAPVMRRLAARQLEDARGGG